MNILLTGFTGNLGPSIAAALADHRVFALVRNGAAPAMRNVMKVTGELDHLPDGVCGDVEVIIHAAANTGFTTPLDELRAVNVTGTEKLLAYARRCPRLQRFVHLSTCCACGTASGTIPEGPLKRPDHFINPYEQSKWEAEQAIQTSGLPYQIVRLSIVAGSETDGHVRHPGALHHALLWLYRGLIPMMPGTVEAPVDVISLEFAAACVAEAVNRTQAPAPVVHAALGARAPRLGELLEHCAGLFRQEHRGWQGGRHQPAGHRGRTDVRALRTKRAADRRPAVPARLRGCPVIPAGTAAPASLCGGTQCPSAVRRLAPAPDASFHPSQNHPLASPPGINNMNTLTPESCSQRLLHFINDVLPTLDRRGRTWLPVAADDALFTEGRLDSLNILHLIGAVEEITGAPVPDQMVVMKHFQSVAAITNTFCHHES